MTPEEMKAAMHQLAEHILHGRFRTNRGKWLQEQIVKHLTDPDLVLYYAERYSREYPYADIKNPYLSQLTQNYDKN